MASDTFKITLEVTEEQRVALQELFVCKQWDFKAVRGGMCFL